MRKLYQRLLTVALITLAVTALSTPASATLMVNIGGAIAGGTVVGGTTMFDNQAGVDANPAIGILDVGAFLNTVAVNFIVNGFATTSGSPTASLSGNANANLDPLAGLPLTVDIFVTDNDFTDPPTPLFLTQTVNLLSSVGGLTANATGVGYYGGSNTEFDVSGPSTANATAVVSFGIGANAPGLSGTIEGPVPYSLTSHIQLNILARGTDPIQNIQVNGNLAAQLIPEPSSTMLLGTGIVGLVLLGRKKLGRRSA